VDDDSISGLIAKMKPRFVLLSADNNTVDDNKVTKITDHNFIAVSGKKKNAHNSVDNGKTQ